MRSRNSIFIFFISFAAIVVLFSSCSIQKRKYVKGYYLDRITQHQNSNTKELTENNLVSPAPNSTQFQASTDNQIELPINNVNEFDENNLQTNCDTIILNNGVKILATVISVGEVNVIYKICDSKSDELKTIESSKVKRVGYADGNFKNLNDDKYIDPYQNSTKQYKSYKDFNSAEAEKGDKQLDNALIWFATCVIFSPGLIVGFILAALARKKLKNKPGYERRYKIANTLTIIGAVILGITLFFLVLYLYLLYLGI